VYFRLGRARPSPSEEKNAVGRDAKSMAVDIGAAHLLTVTLPRVPRHGVGMPPLRPLGIVLRLGQHEVIARGWDKSARQSVTAFPSSTLLETSKRRTGA